MANLQAQLSVLNDDVTGFRHLLMRKSIVVAEFLPIKSIIGLSKTFRVMASCRHLQYINVDINLRLYFPRSRGATRITATG